MPPASMKSIVRDILSADINLAADEAIRKARARGVAAPESSIRMTVHNVRSALKRTGAKTATAPTGPAAAPKPAPTPAAPGSRPAAATSTSAVVRSVLGANLKLTADEVVRKAKARGVTAPEASIRNLVYNIRGELRKKAAGAPKAVPAAARETAGPAPAPTRTAAPKPTPAPTPSSAPDLPGVLANVALVNTVVGVAGGGEQARRVAEAVRACGGVEAFLQHLDLVAGIRGAGTTS